MKDLIQNNKKSIIIIVVLLLLIIILSVITNLSPKNKTNNNTLISSYVTKLKRSDIDLDNTNCDFDNVLKYNNIPYFKLSGSTFDEINKEILTNFLLRTCY